MKVLVLGGTRFFGRSAAAKLMDKGHEVVTVSRTTLSDSPIRHKVCDRKVLSSLQQIICREKPSAILDMVCYDSMDGEGIASLFESGVMSDVTHYLMVSSFLVYNVGTPQEGLFSGDPLTISHGYTRRKIEAEIRLFSSKSFKKMTILRLPFIFSHDDYSNRFQRLCLAVLENRIGIPNNSFRTSMISKNDAADLLVSVIDGPPLGIVDGSNSGSLTLYEIAQVVATALRVTVSPSNQDDLSAIYSLERDLCLHSKKTKNLRPLVEMIALEAVAWNERI
jgi:nucleoside-diphosphate-sugar epimerase